MKTKKTSFVLLLVILFSYFVVGFPDGAFTISWIGIEADMGLDMSYAGWILVGYSVTYTLAGVLLSLMNRLFKLQTIYLIGLFIMGAGFVTLAMAPDFGVVLTAIVIYGFGTGAMAASMNSYMAKHFTASHNNLMHCFWGAGAALTPVLMSQMMRVSTWRVGYYVIVGILGVVAVMLFVSMGLKMWLEGEGQVAQVQEVAKKRAYLTKWWHQVIEIATFFFLGGTDYTLVFFTGMVLLERGIIEDAGWFSAVYYVCMTIGRVVFGYVAKRGLKEVPIIRIGIAVAALGIGVLWLTGSLFGMALTGFGLAPLLPTLVSDTSNRFTPKVLNRLVGLELAAFGAGIAVLFFATSQILTRVSLEALFPIGIGFVAMVFICNEILEYVKPK